MSTDVQQHPPASVASEEFRAHEEAPGFDRTLARARARARGLTPTEGPRRAPERRTADDFAALVARVCRVPVEAVKGAAALRGALEPPPPSRRPNTAGEWRIAHYIPERHRSAVLQLCPAPVEPTAALPAGQCKCKGGKRHFVPQNESQRAALESVCNFVRAAERGEGPALILVGPTGTGKCLGRGTPILMYDGTVRPVEDVRTGDQVMGPDSRPRRVLGTTAGHGRLYRVTPTKGDSYVVNDAHVLSVRMSAGASCYRAGEVVNLSVGEYLTASANFRRLAKGWRTGVDFPEQSVGIDPYLLGLWLGDGDSDRPMIVTPDPEIASYLHEHAAREGLTVSTSREHNNATRYRVGSSGHAYDTNPVLDALRAYELIRNKHIPADYKANSRRVRLHLLAGLLDTDGTPIPGGYEIISAYDALADDILFVARSLGFAAYRTMKPVQLDGWDAPRIYHRITITGDLTELPMRVERKRPQPRRQIKNVLNVGITVEPIGAGEYFGFELDGDHLFLLGDFTVTHNSHLLWAACRHLNERGVNAAGTSWKRLSDTIRDAKSHPDQELRMRAAYERDRYTNATSLHLDEVRATAGTDFDPTELSLIAVERHDNCQALLMTSQQRGAALTALTDSAATGRLAIVEMIGSNYRKPHEAPAGQLRAAVSA